MEAEKKKLEAEEKKRVAAQRKKDDIKRLEVLLAKGISISEILADSIQKHLSIRGPVMPQPKLITGGEIRPLALTLTSTPTSDTLTRTLAQTLALTLAPNRVLTRNPSPSPYPNPPPNPNQVRCGPTSWCAPSRR